MVKWANDVFIESAKETCNLMPETSQSTFFIRNMKPSFISIENLVLNVYEPFLNSSQEVRGPGTTSDAPVPCHPPEVAFSLALGESGS
jgi:hypothetical protein